MAYANGRLPNSVLATIAGTTRKARADVVPQINALRQAFAAHFGKPLVVTDGYRDYDEQVRLKKELGYLAGTPGTSNHGWGLALDLGSRVNIFNTAEYNWVKANAGRFGFYHPGWAEPNGSKPEPWHWETRGAIPVSNYTNIPGVNVPNPGVTPPTPIEEANMPLNQADLEAIDRVTTGRLDQRLASVFDVMESILTVTSKARWYKVEGTTLAWLDLGTSRRMGTAEQYAAAPSGVVPLKLADPFWRLPIVGAAWGGEGYRRPGTSDVWFPDLVDGTLVRRYPGRDGYVAAGSPKILDLPTTHPFWALSVPESDPVAPEGND